MLGRSRTGDSRANLDTSWPGDCACSSDVVSNAGSCLAVADPALGKRLDDLRASEMQKVLAEKLD
mgnify:CR=1 FL=1